MKTLRHTDHPGITIHYYSDWLGVVHVTYEMGQRDVSGYETWRWNVNSGDLLSGKVDEPRNTAGHPVPVRIVAQAVAMAVRAKLTGELIQFAEERT